MAPTTDPIGDAITVLENIAIDDPSARIDTEDAMNRVNTALGYLRLLKERRPPCQTHSDLGVGWLWTCPKCVAAAAYVADVRKAAGAA